VTGRDRATVRGDGATRRGTMTGDDLARGLGVKSALLVIFMLAALVGCGEASDDGSATSPSPSAAAEKASPTPEVSPDFDADVILREFPDGGPRNQVRLENKQDGRFMARAAISLHRIKGDTIDPMNVAIASASCTDCQTIAVALQVVIYERGAHNVQPQNIAIALNQNCTRCVTIARAIQFVVPVDDLNVVDGDIKGLLKDMEKELRYFSKVKTLSEIDPDEANRRLTNVMSQYGRLQQYIIDMQAKRTENDGDDEKNNNDARPSVSPAASPSVSPSTSPSGSGAAPVRSPSESPSPSASPSPSPTP
jgi:putative peptide zinc metalloprotease protein